jgi:hypothetical protein
VKASFIVKELKAQLPAWDLSVITGEETIQGGSHMDRNVMPWIRAKYKLKHFHVCDENCVCIVSESTCARYSVKQFSRLFPAVGPSPHKVHSVTRKATAATSAQGSKLCFHRAIPGIKLSQMWTLVCNPVVEKFCCVQQDILYDTSSKCHS